MANKKHPGFVHNSRDVEDDGKDSKHNFCDPHPECMLTGILHSWRLELEGSGSRNRSRHDAVLSAVTIRVNVYRFTIAGCTRPIIDYLAMQRTLGCLRPTCLYIPTAGPAIPTLEIQVSSNPFKIVFQALH